MTRIAFPEAKESLRQHVEKKKSRSLSKNKKTRIKGFKECIIKKEKQSFWKKSKKIVQSYTVRCFFEQKKNTNNVYRSYHIHTHSASSSAFIIIIITINRVD